MGMKDFLIFIFLLGAVGILGSFVIVRLIRLCTMTKEEVDAEVGSADMVELQNLLSERQWRGEMEGRIVLPRGV